jgi:hypothetical protein
MKMENHTYRFILSRLIEVLVTFSILSLLFSVRVSAKIDTINVPSDIPAGEGNLNTAIQASIDAGTLSNKVFKLEPYGYYILTGTLTIPAGNHLTIIAPEPGTTQNTSPPQIVWTPSGGVSTSYIFEVFGDITLKNIWLLYANTAGNQVSSSLMIQDDPLAVDGQHGIFEGVMFDYSSCPMNSSGAVGVAASHFKGTFKNCYFKNCVDKHFRYYGRALSFPYNTTGWHSDSVTFENCTFANMGWVYMQENGEYADYVKFNHCTFFNVVMFPIESGYWHVISVTNSIFVNTFMFGYIPGLSDKQNGGTMWIDSISTFGFSVPFNEQDRHILFTNSNYYLEKWLTNWMQLNPYSQDLYNQRRFDEIPIPMPMLSQSTKSFYNLVDGEGNRIFPYMNAYNLDSSSNPRFILAPSDTAAIKEFLQRKWGPNTDYNWEWKPMNSINSIWPLEENLAYQNDTIKTAGMGGFPLGDLYHWWPTQYFQWKTQEIAENQNIDNMLNTPINSAIEVPMLFLPTSNAENQREDTLVMKWYSVPNASGYECQLSLSPSFSPLVVIKDSTADTTVTITSLQNRKKYYWRVRAFNINGKGAFSETRSFITIALLLADPMPLSPANNAIDQPAFLKLICSKTSDAAQYHWQVSTDPGFSSFAVNDSTIDTTNAVGSLESGTKYYWRVRIVNPSGASNFTSANSFTVMTAPGIPVKKYPASNQQSIRADTLKMEWYPVPLASGYECQIALSPSFSPLNVAKDSTADTTFTVTLLQNFKKYYWRVRAYNIGGVSEYSVRDSFTTIALLLADPMPLSPTNNAIDQPAVIKLICSKTSDAAQYHWQVSVDQAFSSFAVNDSTTDTTHIVGPLVSGTKYHWRVRGVSPSGASNFTRVDSFTIMTAPGIPIKKCPAGNQQSVRADTLKMEWYPVPLASGYECQIALSPSFSPLFAAKDSTADTTFTVTSLQNLKKYYWRVRAYNIGGASAFSARDSFTTTISIPAAPTLLLPRKGVIGQRIDTLIFNWSSISAASKYVFQLSLDRTFSSYAVNDSSITDTMKIVTNLQDHRTKYFWRVSGYNLAGFGPFSVIDSFTTLNVLPGIPVLISPVDTSNQPTRVTFVWHPTVYTVNYFLQVATDSLFTQIVASVTVDTTSVQISDTLESNTKYYWHVRSWNAEAWSYYSVTAYFTIAASVGVKGIAGIPNEYALFQNFPNPFNPFTQIKYSIPKSSYVSLKIYNLLGKEVATLFDGVQQTGNYIATFNGTGLSSGVYLFRLHASQTDGGQAKNFVETKKLILLK